MLGGFGPLTIMDILSYIGFITICMVVGYIVYDQFLNE